MARLPTADNLGARPGFSPNLANVEERPSRVGDAMVNLGRAIDRAGERIGEKNDEQAVFEARRKLDEWERKTIYDPVNGVVAKRGADALSLPGKVTEEFDTFAGEISGTLGNDRQRKVFQDMAQSRRNQVADFTTRHALQQKEVYETGQVNADMASSADRAVTLAANGNPAAAKAELDLSSERLTSFMKARGKSGEEIAAALKERNSKAHGLTVAALVNKGDPTGAKEYLDANAAGMNADDVTRASGLLKEGVLRAKSQAFADDVMGQGLSMTDSLAKAREKLSGDEEAAAVHEIKTRFAEKEAGRAQAVKQLSNEGWSVVIERGTKALPTTLLDRLRTEAPQELRQMRDWEQAKWRQAKADAEGKDQDPAVFYGLRMMAAEDPQAFGNLDLLKSQPMMSKQHYNHLVELQAGISKGDLKAMESQRVMKSTIQMLKNEIGAAGIDLTLTEKDKGTKKARDTTMFLGALGAALDEATATKGKPLTSDEAKRIGMGMLREGIEQGSGIFGAFQTKKRGFEIAADPDIKPGASFVVSRFSDIPKATRDALAAELRASRNLGTRPLSSDDEAAIERAYTRGVQQGRFK